MAHEPEDTDNDTGDDLNDFETFLREREKQWTKPPVELKTTDMTVVPNLDAQFEIRSAVDGAVESSKPEPKSTEIDVNIQVSISKSADAVESVGASDSLGEESKPAVEVPTLERETEYKLHTHPIVGTYVTEESVAWRLDQEAFDLFTNMRQTAVTDITLEEIIERIHKMTRSYKLIRIAQQGLISGMAERLAKMNEVDRAKYQEMHREAALKNSTRTRIERVRKKAAQQGGEIKAAPKKAGKTPLQKRVDFFRSSGYSKEYVINHMKEAKHLDAALGAYIDKLVWES